MARLKSKTAGSSRPFFYAMKIALLTCSNQHPGVRIEWQCVVMRGQYDVVVRVDYFQIDVYVPAAGSVGSDNYSLLEPRHECFFQTALAPMGLWNVTVC